MNEPFETVPLSRVGLVLGGGTPTSDECNWGGDIPFVTPPDLRGLDGQIVQSTQRTISAEGAQGSTVVGRGSVIVSTRAPIGYVARLDVRSAFNQGCRAVVPATSTDACFLGYALVAAREEMEVRGQGTTFMELSGHAFASMRIPFPPLDEQRAIADYLDDQTAKIDALIAKQEQMIELLEERRVAEISAPFEGRRGHGVALKHLLDGVDQGVSPSASQVPASADTWGVLKAGCVNRGVFRQEQNKRLDDTFEFDDRIAVSLGDVLVSRASGSPDLVGSAARVLDLDLNLILSDKTFRLRPSTTTDPDWLVCFLNSRAYREQVRLAISGAEGLANNLPLSSLRNFRVPGGRLSLAEQLRVAARVGRETAKIDALVTKTREHIALAKERRSALITAAVTGQVDVRTGTREVV